MNEEIAARRQTAGTNRADDGGDEPDPIGFEGCTRSGAARARVVSACAFASAHRRERRGAHRGVDAPHEDRVAVHAGVTGTTAQALHEAIE